MREGKLLNFKVLSLHSPIPRRMPLTIDYSNGLITSFLTYFVRDTTNINGKMPSLPLDLSVIDIATKSTKENHRKLVHKKVNFLNM